MKIRKPYTISESEKNRIRGLHGKLLKEDSGHDEAMNYGRDEGHDDKELYDLKHHGGSKRHIDNLEDDMHFDHIHDDYDMEEEIKEIAVWGEDNEDWKEEMGEEVLTDLNGNTYEVAETAIPQGWRKGTPQDIAEEEYMSDLYEVWLGHEETEVISEGIGRPVKELVYELPSRFGNKRLTESELVNMINTIIK